MLNDHSSSFGVYKVVAKAKNVVTPVELETTVNAIITSAPCTPPEVGILDNSTDNRAPVRFMRSKPIVVKTLAKLSCSPVVSTR